MGEYPLEMRLVNIEDGFMNLSTVGLDPIFKEKSLIPERNNQWVKGMEKDRTAKIPLE